MPPTPNEDYWRERLNKSKMDFEIAVAQYEMAKKNVSLGLKPVTDYQYALRRAEFKEMECRVEYLRVLKIFSDIVLRHNILPREGTG